MDAADLACTAKPEDLGARSLRGSFRRQDLGGSLSDLGAPPYRVIPFVGKEPDCLDPSRVIRKVLR